MTLKELHLPSSNIFLYESRHSDGDVVHVHHHNVHQILYALEGEGKIFMDGKEYTMTPDHAAFIVPQTKHAIYSSSTLTILVLAFDVEALQWMDFEIVDHFQKSYFFQQDFLTSSELRQHLRTMLYEQSSNEEFSDWAVKVHLLHILLRMARLKDRAQIQDTNWLRTEKIKSFIDTHYYEPLTAKEIATKLGVSSRYMQTIFKEHYDKTPMQYLTEVRIEKAKDLLATTDKEIITICFEVGYETLSTFYRAFKNSMNMSPKQYRDKVAYLDSGEK